MCFTHVAAYKYVSANKSHVAVMEVPCYGLHQVSSFVNSREPVYMLPDTCDSANANDVALFIRDTTRQLKLANVLFIYTGISTFVDTILNISYCLKLVFLFCWFLIHSFCAEWLKLNQNDKSKNVLCSR